MQNIHSQFNAPCAPLIVCGFPRSGTTLLYNLLHQTVASHQFLSQEEGYRHWLSKLSKQRTNKPFLIKRTRDLINAAQKETPDTIPLIVLIRDIRDILVSKHAGLRLFNLDDYCISSNFSYAFNKETRRLTTDGPGILSLAQKYTRLTERRNGKNIFICRYEDLILNPNQIQNKLERMGITYKENKLFTDWGNQTEAVAAINLNGIRAIDEDNTGKWRLPEHRERIKSQFLMFPELFEWLITLGYETDHSWANEIGLSQPKPRSKTAVPSVQ